MRRRRSAGSIFWGLTLVGIGALLLARNLGYSIPVWSALARYWPVLIIAWGLVKLLDYYRFRRSGEDRPLFSGGEVALLILVIFAGSAMTAAANISPSLAEFFDFSGDFDFWDITGNNYEYTEHQEAEVPPGSTIEIVNMYGTVDVKPSGSNRVVLDVKKTVRAANREEADSRAGQFTFTIRNENGKVRIASSRDDDFGRPSVRVQIGNERQRYKSSLVIQVPKSASLQLNNRNGGVEVADLMGDQSIVNRYGQVTLRGITGSVTVENRNASVVVEDVSAAATITNRYGSVTARNLGGRLEIENRYGGVDVRDVKGNSTISNTYSVISAANVEGQLDITGRNNSVDIDGVTGPLTIETSYKHLSVRNARNNVDVKNRHGEIVIEFEQPPQYSVSVSDEYGDVVLNLPPESAFSIDARTRSGEIVSEFDELRVSSSGRERSLSGRLGSGGPQIRIETRNGDIRIEKRG